MEEAITVRIRQSTMVRPAEPTPRHRLWISNIDLVGTRANVRTIYFYRPNGSPDFFDSMQLRDALARVLVSFYPVAGRKTKDEAGRLEIDCNDQGVLFLEADSEATLDDFGDFAPTMKLKQLIPEVDATKDRSSYPLLLLQVTYFKCGGVSLGVSIDHQLVDGVSGLHFINSWSDVVGGATCVNVAPLIDRSLLRARSPPTPRFPHAEYQPSPPMSDFSAQMNSVKIFKLTRELLNVLINKHSPPGAAYRYSTYVVIATHLWRCVCIARELLPDQVTQLYFAVDGRRRLRPPIKEGYLGNVMFTATLTATMAEMLMKSADDEVIPRRIHEAITRMDDEYLRSLLDYLELQPNLDVLTWGPQQHQSPNFRLISWTRLPVHDADFKWGRPVFMGPGCTSHEGKAYLLPSPTHDGSLSLAICLKPQHMLNFEKLIYDTNLP